MTTPDMYLSDSVNESFERLRAALGSELGWDYLDTLENAAVSLTSLPQAGITENWLYTGRAIGVNEVPMEMGWMAVSREDYLGQTYWRVWLKCYLQDGTCGSPMRSQIWDFSARYSDDRTALENGGKTNGILEGYWVDFTEFASRYGWQRLPANTNWRTYYQGAQVNIFVLRESLSWKDAMLQLYPAETIESMRVPTP
jgi:TolB protein